MAEKRMFSNKVIGSDTFLEMPDSTQNLYFHLSMSADDDGFVDKWKSIMRMTGKKDDDLKLLIVKSFIIPFDSGVLVIKDWRINNYLRKDRYNPTKYLSERKELLVSENQSYERKSHLGIPAVDTDKNSIDKNNIYIPHSVSANPSERETLVGSTSCAYGTLLLKEEVVIPSVVDITTCSSNTHLPFKAEKDIVITNLENKSEEPKFGAKEKEEYVAELFEKIWKVYSRKVNKQLAKKTWAKKLKKQKTREEVLEKAKKIGQALNLSKKDWFESDRKIEFIPHFSSWLNANIPD